MTTKPMLLVGFGDGLGVKLIDATTGDIARDSKGTFNTDDLLWSSLTPSGIITLDYDGKLNTFTRDLVHTNCVEIPSAMFSGMYGWKAYPHIVGNTCYMLVRKGEKDADGNEMPLFRQGILRKHNATTGAFIEDIVLDADLQVDDGFGTIRCGLDYGGGIYGVWTDTHVWAFCGTGTYANKLVKIDLSNGTVADSIAATSLPSWQSCVRWIDATHIAHLNRGFTIDTAGYQMGLFVYDTVAKTEQFFPIYTDTDTLPVADFYTSTGSARDVWFDLATKEIKLIGQDSGPDGYNRYNVCSINWETATISNVPIVVKPADNPDSVPNIHRFQGYRFNDTATELVGVSDQEGFFRIDTATGLPIAQKDYFFTDSINGKGVDIESLIMVTMPAYTLTGNVKAAGINATRTVALYDQASKELLATTVSDGTTGNYALSCFSTDKKFTVCEAPNGTDFIAHAHRVPV